jgi:hypothetical protein
MTTIFGHSAVHAQIPATTKEVNSTFHSGFDSFVVPGSV